MFYAGKVLFTPGMVFLSICTLVDDPKYRYKWGLKCFEIVHFLPFPQVVENMDKMYMTVCGCTKAHVVKYTQTARKRHLPTSCLNITKCVIEER